MSNSRQADRFSRTTAPGEDRRRFDRFLQWLAEDRESAGVQYEKIRRRLISLLSLKGAEAPEELADKVLDRVVGKIDEVAPGYEGDPYYYIVRVARLVFLESVRKRPVKLMPRPVPKGENEHRCLDLCLGRLSDTDRDQLLSYYRFQKTRKIRHRQEMAARLGIDMNTLRLRIFRLRRRVGACVAACLEKNDNFETFQGEDSLRL